MMLTTSCVFPPPRIPLFFFHSLLCEQCCCPRRTRHFHDIVVTTFSALRSSRNAIGSPVQCNCYLLFSCRPARRAVVDRPFLVDRAVLMLFDASSRMFSSSS